MPLLPNRTVYIGIDPGKIGGLVALTPKGILSSTMPPTDRDIWDWLCLVLDNDYKLLAVIEKVQGYIGPRGGDAPGSAMFNFGMNYGLLRMALTASGIPFEQVTPHKWQRALGIPSRKSAEGRTEWKNRLKQHAQQLFPEVKVTLAMADALLIALYCKRKHEGTL